MTDTGTPEPRGAILQRDKQTYAIVPRTPCGMLSPDILDAISRVARKYAIPIIKITSGQRLALVGMTAEQVEPIWEELSMDVGRAVELCVHYVQACPGTAVCRLGLQDSLGLGIEIEQKLAEQPFPAKVKFGVSGCPMCCGESYLRDVGLVGTKRGWTVIVGGKPKTCPARRRWTWCSVSWNCTGKIPASGCACPGTWTRPASRPSAPRCCPQPGRRGA